MVKTIFVSGEPNGYTVQLLYLVARQGTGEDTKNNVPYIVSGYGETVATAVQNASQKSGKIFFYAQNKLILLEHSMDHTAIWETLRCFSEERYASGKINVWTYDAKSLPSENDDLQQLADDLEKLSDRQDGVAMPLFRLSENRTYAIPSFVICKDAVRGAAFYIVPVEGNCFWLTGREFDLCRALLAKSGTITCLSGENICTVKQLHESYTVVRENGTLRMQMQLRGKIYDYEGELSKKEAARQASEELKNIVSLLYHDLYLQNKADILSLAWQFGQYDCHTMQLLDAQNILFDTETLIVTADLKLQ